MTNIYRLPPKISTASRRRHSASEKLTENVVDLGWRTHQLAVEIADHHSNAVTQNLRRLATAQWRQGFLRLPE